MKRKKRLLALLTALLMVMSVVMNGQIVPAIAEETEMEEETGMITPVEEQLSGETVPESAAEVVEQVPEVSEPVTESKTEAAEPVTEPKTEAAEPVIEPKPEVAEPVIEPKPEVAEPVTELWTEGTEVGTEIAGIGQNTENAGSDLETEESEAGENTEPGTENTGAGENAELETAGAGIGIESGTEESGTEAGTESIGTEPGTEEEGIEQGTELGTEVFDTEEVSESETESETESEEKEEKLMEQTLVASGSGEATVTLTGVMPENGRAEAKPVQVEIEGQTVLAAYDITIYDGKDRIYQPEEGTIQVMIVDAAVQEALDKAEDLTVYHMEDASSAPQEIQEVTTTAAEVVFEAESFSIYVVATPETHYTYTYIFYDSDGTTEINKQILSVGEILKEPKSPASTDNKIFLGWYTESGEKFTAFNSAVTEEDLRNTNGESESKTLTLYAHYDTAYYVFYKAEATEESKVLYTQKYENGAAIQTGDVPFSTGDVDLALIGWSVDANAETPDAELRINGEDVILYPVVKAAHWITYDSQGGSSVDPAYVLASGVTVAPTAAPMRKGYEFAGWYSDAEGEKEFTFGSALTENITLYAKWTPAQTSYTVIFWKQQVTDDKYASDNEKKYDYGESVVRSAATGTTVSVTSDDTQKNYTGFKYNENKQLSVTVAADGSTVLNVYYDRKLITLNFYTGGWNSSLIRTLTGLYGSTLKANGYEWDTESNWTYRSQVTGGTITQTYMDAFIPPIANVGNATTMDFTRSARGDVVITHYTEDLDGNWEKAIVAYGNKNSTFNLSDKFNGFSVSAYRKNGRGDWQNCKDGDKVTGYNALDVRHKRNSYRLDYNNGTEGTVKSESVKYEQTLDAYESYQPPRPSDVPDYYSFKGWYKDPEGTESFDFTQTMPTNNLVVYAKWAPEQVTVSFETSGGTAIESQMFNAGLTAEKPYDPVREGYTFAGWTRNDQPFNFNTEILEDTVLVAQWISNDQYTISYDPNGAVDGDNKVITAREEDPGKYANGAKAKVQAVPQGWNAPEEGDGFICWNTSADGTGTDYYPSDTYTMPDANVVLYAKWAPCRKTTLTYDYNGGVDKTTNTDSESVTIDIPNGEYGIQKDGSGIFREGYVFIGWSTVSDGTGTLLQKDQLIQVDTINPENNVLYAQWEKLLTVTVKKLVKGNMGSMNTPFSFTYTVTPPEGTTVNNAVLSGTDTFNLKADEEFKLSNIIPGSRIAVTETAGSTDGYVTHVQKTGDEQAVTANTCEISDIEDDIVIAFTNTKDIVPPTGLTDNGAPFTAMVLLSLTGLAGLFLLRRRDRQLL